VAAADGIWTSMSKGCRIPVFIVIMAHQNIILMRKKMNERINQLAQQADELDYQTFDSYNQTVVQHYKFNKEKFAELIVRECMQQVEEQYLPMMENQDAKGPNRDTYWDSYVQCGVDSNVAIKQHFGIEE
jgi:hypothetical protein